ncbi:NAD(P)H-hydrate dehydratase [Enterococcus hulanensis]|uniref:ADP-dependent (S)-NAD(P)H-hydrate dehydratase n=1 Tax=Enterococcus hulanensis TaxID=2559929 RepID=A0ABU3F0F9_9ENTE|nr:NAD(P)H-hydrate dehydratase [Enterococcus hulanensis]MDT2600620.1 NAD(P)H-hydrate dehydratase [Enterococcus hulanensis]MDT2610143.1 NAD(P)H-hydrate dehydratase [Enterococcus hulanensis]MDT2617449.1 NAD(P)H-hydrate dehydratase [Enterococcus hulanensis]MDT2628088.1 NAD(P)H-hydrate dehydratase [Enterococcus hulanensis]MDT2655193.1 NAD(P)H-hydrate dehydratase [Enterococcus hulanensis]
MVQLNEEILHKVITKRPEISHKGTFGRVVLIGGNQQYGGAIIMSAEACIKSGAGLTTVVTAEKNHSALHARLPEAMVLAFWETTMIYQVLEKADVVLIGPGLGLDKAALTLLKGVLKSQKEQQWLVIDGSAISLFSEYNLSLKHPEQTVFTPHQAEWERLSGLSFIQQTDENNRAKQALLGAKIALKSHRTTIYDEAIAYYQNPLGNPGMATGGTGDTLAGMITGFLAQFEKNIDTIGAAVYLHSLIGDELAKDHYVVLPTSISEALPRYMKKYATERN